MTKYEKDYLRSLFHILHVHLRAVGCDQVDAEPAVGGDTVENILECVAERCGISDSVPPREDK